MFKLKKEDNLNLNVGKTEQNLRAMDNFKLKGSVARNKKGSFDDDDVDQIVNAGFKNCTDYIYEATSQK